MRAAGKWKKIGISLRSVLKILHQHKFHPYRMSLHQDLYGNDFLKRVAFCNWIRRKMRTDVSFLSHLLFTDEANFANTGNVNSNNMNYWANENPLRMRPKPRLVDPSKVINPICFDFSTIFILCMTRMTLCSRALNSS